MKRDGAQVYISKKDYDIIIFHLTDVKTDLIA